MSTDIQHNLLSLVTEYARRPMDIVTLSRYYLQKEHNLETEECGICGVIDDATLMPKFCDAGC